MKLSAFAFITMSVIFPPRSQAKPHNIFEDDWTPPKVAEIRHQAPASQPPATDPTVATPVPPIKRLAIPSKTEQAAARKIMREVFVKQLADSSPPARRKLAEVLLSESEKTNSPPEQFVLLTATMDAAIDAGSLPLAFKAANRLAEKFEIDGLEIKAEATIAISPKEGASESPASNIRAALKLTNDLAGVGDWPTAVHVCSALQSLAAGSPDLRGLVQARLRQLGIAREAAERVAKDKEKLAKLPDDPAANLAVGRYLCLFQNDWAMGLPMLAKGSDPLLKELATKELAANTNAALLATVADGWWDAARVFDPAQHAAALDHALSLYERAVESTSGLRRVQIEKRIAEVRISAIDPEGCLAKAQYLDWKGETWRNDIRSDFKTMVRADGIELKIDTQGYEHKLILFNTVDPRRRVMTLRIKVESGKLNIGFRPIDLAPQGLQLKEKLKPGDAVDVRIWIEGNRPVIELDGQEAVLTGENSKLGWIALMPERSCRFSIQQIATWGR